MIKPKVCVIITDGTNCHEETKRAFDLVGGDSSIVHYNSLVGLWDPVKQREEKLSDYEILAIPGGFSYGDHIASGRIFVEYLKLELGEQLNRFIEDKKPVIGICNGFQVLIKGNYLPFSNGKSEQVASLTYNESYRFRDDWISLTQPINSKCIWTKGIDSIDLPIAHGEGRFAALDDLVEKLFQKGQVVFQYSDENGQPTMKFPQNPNGSVDAIAGICNLEGNVFGLMPHPERYVDPLNHRFGINQRLEGTLPNHGLGLQIFRNGVEYCR